MTDEIVAPSDQDTEQQQDTGAEGRQPEQQAESQAEPAAEKPPEGVTQKSANRFQQLAQERDYWRKQAESAAQAMKDKPAPKLEDFDHDIEKFTTAAMDHKAQEIAVNSVEQQAQRADEYAARELEATFNRATADAVKQFPDFDKVFDNTVPVSLQMAEAIVISDKPADIAYYLGTNREEAAKIAALPPHMQGYEIARLEARLSSAPIVSRAPSPPSQRVAGTNASAGKSYDDMSMEEFLATRRKEEAARRSNSY